MIDRSELEKKFMEFGFKDFRWIDPKKIVVSQWVRMKCRYGCDEYGHNAACPPNAPSIPECERFFREYKDIAVFHFSKKVDKPEDRHDWTKRVCSELLKLERDIFLSGHRKAFLLFLDSCHFCADCASQRVACKLPKMARPTPEALGMDVFTTVRQIGYPIEVLSEYHQTMNRYAFLLIE